MRLQFGIEKFVASQRKKMSIGLRWNCYDVACAIHDREETWIDRIAKNSRLKTGKPIDN